MDEVNVQIPSKAVSDGTDVRKPVRDLLEDLNLLGTPDETNKAKGFIAAFSGPPQSVAVIEGGVTAATKWWAAGLGATVIATWARVGTWWGGQPTSIKEVVLAGSAFLTAAVAVAISYLLASDVRGRAAASVATINARARVAIRMIQAAEDAYKAPAAKAAIQLVPLPAAVKAKNLAEAASNEKGWLAVAMERQPDGSHKYVLVKGGTEAVVDVSKLEFD